MNVNPTASPLQIVKDEADDITGTALFVKTTSSKTEQGPSVTVHLNVAEDPEGTAVTVEVGEVGLVMVAVPEIIVQSPVPGDGVFPVRVNDPLPH